MSGNCIDGWYGLETKGVVRTDWSRNDKRLSSLSPGLGLSDMLRSCRIQVEARELNVVGGGRKVRSRVRDAARRLDHNEMAPVIAAGIVLAYTLVSTTTLDLLAQSYMALQCKRTAWLR